MLIALFFIALGTIFLLKNLELITVGTWNILWPALIIIVGISIIFKKRHRPQWWDFFDNKSSDDWDRWGRRIGQRFEEMGKQLEERYRNNPEEWGREFGKKMEKRIKRFFETDTDTSERDDDNGKEASN